MASSEDLPDYIVLAIDYGTTYSAAAFAYAGSPEAMAEITVHKSWPGSNGVTSEKVPSEIAYEIIKQGTKRDYEGELIAGSGTNTKTVLWGFELDPQVPRLRYLKLRLDQRQDYPPSVSQETIDRLLSYSGVTTEEAVSDFIAAVYSQAKEAMSQKFEGMISTTPIKVILTVPAVWSDAAKDATLRAAEKAGLGTDIRMISEPEAAANYAISSIDHKHKLLHVGDNFIIADCGGGTIDLISLEESAPGTGALCGGAFLNLRFEELVRSRMGSEAFDAHNQRKPKSWPIALRYFEDFIKRNFNPLSSQTTYDKKKYHVPFPGAADDLAIGIEDGFLTVSTAEIAEIFRPIVNGVIDLVERQRIILAANHKTPKGVILVGGFGQSNYLFRCLKQRFADEAPPPTYTQAANNLVPESEGPRFMVLQPENPWTAVVRGAVMSGLEKDVVVSRKARRYYGVVISRKWDAATHSLENKHWSTIRSEWRARNQISWCIEKGQSVPVDQPVLFGFSHQWDFDNGYPATVEPRIIVSNAASAPSEFKETVETRTLCRLLTKLKDVPRKHFKTRTKNGKKNRRLDYSIGVLVNSGSLEFDLRVDGVIYGKVRADYE